jgi:hypothetical protein
MTTSISMPVRFDLPEGWQPADPAKSGAPAAAFVAVHPDAHDGLTANITLGEKDRSDQTSLDDVADEALGRLLRLGRDVVLVRRTNYGSVESPAIAQLATLTIILAGKPREMTQYQVFLAMVGTGAVPRRLILEAALTATPEQFEKVVGDFGKFVSSLKLDVD